ncbi:MAG: hypothetical protein QOD42_854 [Sphingomonadales bacterium]|jgi:uncharacterized repeat protein (TIGR01451 family)|nr:hypothetical protein [Sphingomonadales bacterium]
MKLILILLAFLLPSAALAQNQVALNSEVFVERAVQDANGTSRVALEPPGVVTPGDQLVFVLSYRNNGAAPASDFTVTNPLPDSVSFAGTESAGAVYSVDGGRSWGALAALHVRNPDGSSRPAALADVTHVRWRLALAIPAGGGGELRFRGVVK